MAHAIRICELSMGYCQLVATEAAHGAQETEDSQSAVAAFHPYELFLQLEDIEHRTTRVRRPQSNGFIERFHRTLLDEHLRVKGRTTWYETLEEMQKDLEAYLEQYNTKRPHRGRGMEGKTPYQVFKAGLKEAKKAARTREKSEKKEAA